MALQLRGRFAIVAATCVSLASCSIHPLTDDSVKLTSYQISRQIACETRQAVINNMLGFLTSPANRQPFPSFNSGIPFVRLNDHSYDVGLKYAAKPDAIVNFSPSELSGNARAIIELMWNTGVAYNYNLEMTELNANGGSLNFLNAFPSATRTLGLTAKTDLQRQNTRLFTIASTFGKMVAGPLAAICKPEYLREQNYLYPIAGEIGMKRLIGEFVQFAIFGNLTGDLSKDFTATAGTTQLAEQLEFTTTLDLSVTPKVTFSPAPLVGAGFHVADASITAQAQRKDLHKLTIGLFVPVKGLQSASQQTVLGSLSGAPNAGVVATRVTEPGERGALRAVNELLTLKLFQLRVPQ